MEIYSNMPVKRVHTVFVLYIENTPGGLKLAQMCDTL